MSDKQIDHLPMQVREARFAPATVDSDARTVELCWTTGASVRRRTWEHGEFEETLSLDDSAVRLERLNSGAPLLDSHQARSLTNIVGVVEKAWFGKAMPKVGMAIVRFSDRPDVEPIWRDVKNGILRNVSVGYQIHRAEMKERKGKPPLMTVVDWEPHELSLVSIPADARAQVRAEDRIFPCIVKRSDDEMATKSVTDAAGVAVEDAKEQKVKTDRAAEFAAKMKTPEEEPAAERPKAKETRAEAAPVSTPAPAGPSEDEIRRRIQAEIEAERERAEAIRHATRVHKFEPEVGERLIKSGVSLTEGLRVLLQKAYERQEALEAVNGPAPRVEAGAQDEEMMRAKALRSAILHRYDPEMFKPECGGERYLGMSLLELGRHCLENAGVRTAGMGRNELAKRALLPGYGVRASGLHTTSDFVNVLADVANKTLRQAYDQAPRTFTPFARRTTAPDFKSINRVQLGEAPQLLTKNEHGEFVRGTIGDAKETYALVTYGRVFGITREVVVNDDLDAFTRIPALFGNAAAQKESDVVWAVVTANANMADGVALFASGHGNLNDGGAAAITVTSVGAGRKAMRMQKGLDGVTLLNIQPAFLIVPAELETVGEQFLTDTLYPAQISNVVPASLRRSLSLIVEPRLGAADTNAWFLAASPSQIDTIEYAYLEGEEGVMIDSRVGFDVDGVEVRARLDFAAKAIDYRGLYKNDGA